MLASHQLALFHIENTGEVSMPIMCNVPFCQNIKNPNHSFCSKHRWEREKYKVKPYKELLPLWAVKRCKIHGLLKSYQIHINSKSIQCILCKKSIPYCPVKQKYYNQKYSSKRKSWRLRKRYGISLIDYQTMLINQKSCCAICSISIIDYQSKKGNGTHFSVDHCHVTNKVRGLLCHTCNLGIGYFKDSPHYLDKAIKYLQPNKEL